MPDGGDDLADTEMVETVPCSEAQPCPSTAEVCDLEAGFCVTRCTPTSCSEGTSCDALSGLCVEGQACSASEPCAGADETCDICRGLCVPTEGREACVEAINCLSAEYCDSCTSLCLPKKAICETCVRHE